MNQTDKDLNEALNGASVPSNTCNFAEEVLNSPRFHNPYFNKLFSVKLETNNSRLYSDREIAQNVAEKLALAKFRERTNNTSVEMQSIDKVDYIIEDYKYDKNHGVVTLYNADNVDNYLGYINREVDHTINTLEATIGMMKDVDSSNEARREFEFYMFNPDAKDGDFELFSRSYTLYLEEIARRIEEGELEND